MKLLLSLVVTASMLHMGCCLMGSTAFSEYFKPRCFPSFKDNVHLKMGQQLPLGFTVSSFLDKLQILEQKLAERLSNQVTAVDMAVYLLRTFYHDDYVWENLAIKDVGNADRTRNVLHQVMDAVMANLGRPAVMPDELLGDQQRRNDDLCFLMYSMAHNVNKTLEPRFELYSASEDDDIKKRPREEGVLSVTGKKDGAVVAMGRTLLGIAAAHKDLQPKSIPDVLKALNVQDVKNESDGSLNPIPAATLGYALAVASLLPDRQMRSSVGLRGKWLEHGCFLEYKLDQDTNTSCTMAGIAGAIDGYILGMALNEYPDLRTWNLSTVLRLYYGPRGIATGTSQTLGHCKRSEQFSRLNNRDLRQQIENFGLTLAHLGLVTGVESKKSFVSQRVGQAMGLLQEKLGDLNRESSDREVCPSGVNENERK